MGRRRGAPVLAMDWWRTRAGKALFTFLCAGLGAAAVTFTIHNLGLIAVAAGGAAGVAKGTILGVQQY